MKIVYKLSLLILLTFISVRGMSQYCTPTYTYGCSDGDGLTSFAVNTISQSIPCDGSTTNYYIDYSSTVSTNLLVNTPYTVTVVAGYSSTYVKVWVDLNNDNIFSTSEVLGTVTCSSAGVNYTFSVTIPTGTANGNHRLRFRTNYFGEVTDPCTSLSFGNSADFTVVVGTPGHCQPLYTTGCTSGHGLTSFQLNTISQAIPCTDIPSYYHNYTALSTDLTTNLPYTLTVQAGTGGTHVTVWVDLNNNNAFNQPSEVMIADIVCTNAFTNYSATLTIPNGTSLGLHRLRFRTNWNAVPGDPCAALNFGNAADFTINVQSECLPGYSSGCAFDDGLTLFQLNNINQPILCDGSPNTYYHDYTAISTDVPLNIPTTVTVKAGFSNTYVTVWVDLNSNNIFDQPSEVMVSGLHCILANTSYSAIFTIPAGTSLGAHRLRYRTEWLEVPGDPCTSLAFGNSADFTLMVVPPAPPVSVTNPPSAVLPDGATLHGTIDAKGANTNVSFEYGLTTEYGSSIDGVPAIVVGSGVTSISADLSGLITNQTYHYRIKGSSAVSTTYGDDYTFVTCPAGPAGPISGLTVVCRGESGVVYSVDPISNAEGYVWTVPSGAVITYGESPNTIMVDFTVTSVSGNVTVYGSSECGSGTMATLPVNVSIAPNPMVSGAEVVCADDVNVYTTLAGMADYDWWVSPNGMVVAGGTAMDNTVTVKWYSNGAGSLKVNYTNESPCASTYQPYHQVTINYQPIPVITGTNLTCAGITGLVYTTEPGMTDYTWTIVGGGTITAGGTSEDNTITVTWTGAGNNYVYVNYTGANGCRATLPTEFLVMVNPEVAPTISGPAVATTGGLGFAYFTEANWSDYSWNVSAGGAITAGGTSVTNNVVVVWNTPGPQWVSVNYSNGDCTPPYSTMFTVVVGDPAPINGVSGKVTYANQSSTPMKNTTVKLKDQTGTVVHTTVTDISGDYSFTDVEPGFYTVIGQTTKPWGGANSTDALLAMKHFIAMSPLSGLNLTAADVNASSSINAVDALMIAKRYVNQISEFSAGDWAFEISSVIVSNAVVAHDMKTRCYGDLNGSYVPTDAKIPATTFLQQQGEMEISSGSAFDLTFRLNNNINVGAVSILIYYPAEFISVEGVEMDKAGDLAFTAQNGELRISWYSLSGLDVSDNALLTLKLRSKDLSHASASDLYFSLDGSSEISDANAFVIQDANMSCPKLTVTTNAVSLSNYPNPFNGTTTINFNVPVDGMVSLVLYNLLGEEVSVLINNEFITAANHQITLSSNSLEAGVYICKLTASDVVYSHRITVIK